MIYLNLLRLSEYELILVRTGLFDWKYRCVKLVDLPLAIGVLLESFGFAGCHERIDGKRRGHIRNVEMDAETLWL